MSGLAVPCDHFADLTPLIEKIEPENLLRLAWSDPARHRSFRFEPQYRFNAPDGSFGVLYAAFDLATAFAETVLRDTALRAPAGSRVPLDYSELADRRVIEFRHVKGRPHLRLIQLFGAGLQAVRADNQISSRDEYAITQQWAKALHDHPVAADGIAYMSRYVGSEKSVALFNRCEGFFEVAGVVPLLEHPQFPYLVDTFDLAITRP